YTRELTPEERKALVAVQSMQKAAADNTVLTPDQEEALTKITVPKSDGSGTVTGLEAFQKLHELEKSNFLSLILDSSEPVMPVRMIINPAYTFMLLNILVIAVLWFGCNNAAKEIVKEEAIYGRERAVNLRIGPYLGSKMLVLGVIAAIQTLQFLVTI